MIKLNNKGQTLALFVIFIPVIIMIGIYVVDIGICKYNKNKLDNINTLVINDYLDKKDSITKDEVLKLILKNDNEIESEVNISDDKIKLTLKKDVKGAFGNIIGKKIYNIKSVYTGYVKDDKKIIERDE